MPQVGVEGLDQDFRGEGWLAWATLKVHVRCVTEGMDPGIGAAGNGEPDRCQAFQPPCGLLQGDSEDRLVVPGLGGSLTTPPPQAHLQVVLYANSALGAPHSCDPTAERGE